VITGGIGGSEEALMNGPAAIGLCWNDEEKKRK